MYVDDLIEGFIRMMSTPDNVTGPINLGNPVEFTMIELAEKIIALTKSKSKLIHKPLPQDDPTQRKPDITLAKNTLNGWNPKVKLEDGLVPTIEYFSKIIKS
jgi:UDP-glucuronate decarboxylase